MTPTVGETPRHAALLLHAMDPADRAWLLASLTSAHRGRIHALLQELQDLGIPPDAELLRPVLEAPPVPQRKSSAQRMEQLSQLETGVLEQALQAEPPQLVERLRAMLDRSAPADLSSVRDAAFCDAAVAFLAQHADRPVPPPRGAARWRGLLSAGGLRGQRT